MRPANSACYLMPNGVVCKVRSNLNVEPLSCLVPCIGADGACSGVPTKLCVIIHNFAQQLFNQLLADRIVLTARQFCHRLCNCRNYLIGIDRVRLAGSPGILSIKFVDQFEHLAMKAGSFLVISLFPHECPSFCSTDVGPRLDIAMPATNA